MALKGLDIFKHTPKTNCKDCGNPTCMAFAMKVAQGLLTLDKCPHMTADARAELGDATAPPMKSIALGPGGRLALGGETVLFRHDKTFVSKTLYAVAITPDNCDAALRAVQAIDYDRLGEREYIEMIYIEYSGDCGSFISLAQRVVQAGRVPILDCAGADADTICAVLDACADSKPLLTGADAQTYKMFGGIASRYDVVLGVSGADIGQLYETAAALEQLGNKKLVFDIKCAAAGDAFAAAVQIRRAAITGNKKIFGYPALINAGRLAPGDAYMQTALASLFTMRYGSIIVMETMSYAQALPLFGLRQNIFSDPQKPMRVQPGIYPLNGADENSICVTTVDFALTYFIVSGELERSGVPMNLLISDAGGYSVLTAWAAGKLSALSLAKFFKEYEIESKIKSRTLVIPGKVAVLKGEIEESLPGWKIIVAPNEAIELVRFFREYKADANSPHRNGGGAQ